MGDVFFKSKWMLMLLGSFVLFSCEAPTSESIDTEPSPTPSLKPSPRPSTKPSPIPSVSPIPTPVDPDPSIPLTVGSTWHWHISGMEKLDANKHVKMYDIDLFDTTVDQISNLKSKGVYVVCYVNAGSWEDWRSDASRVPSEAKGKAYQGWAGEFWWDIRHAAVRNVFKTRLDLAVQKGCQGIEPDNLDGYQTNTGFPLTERDQIEYNRFLAAEAHKRGMTIGQKNAGNLVPDLVDHYDYAITESIFAQSIYSDFRPYIEAGKPVFSAEYTGVSGRTCQQAASEKFSVVFFKLDLTGAASYCP